jgi:regulator of protease activity HflC (stomatin/prohibitin superfamily)
MEKITNPKSGYIMLIASLLILTATILAFANAESIANPVVLIIPGLIGIVMLILILPGFLIVNPNDSSVLVLFGLYQGTVKDNGFFWVNPFNTKKHISLRARNFDSQPIKVNDKVGNPIMIGLVLVWKVEDTYKASFDVDKYEHFVIVQSDAALRKLAGLFPYDNFEDERAEITLRASNEEVSQRLEEELKERLAIAGIQVIEARINYIAYAQEIAGAMLRRQQATAVVAARSKIVEGAVGMVQMALDQLSKKQIVDLDEEKKAAMVSNLMVVLCSDESARPVVNAGTLHQ